jgi:hypothetical protein
MVVEITSIKWVIQEGVWGNCGVGSLSYTYGARSPGWELLGLLYLNSKRFF